MRSTPEPVGEPATVAERVSAKHRAELRRLLVAGLLIAVLVVALGIIVVYGLDQAPGMAEHGDTGTVGLRPAATTGAH